MTELALTRIFSVVMYYHFAFLAISIALFGLSASGVYAYLRRRALDRQPTETLLARQSLIFAIMHDRRALRAGPPAGRPQLFALEPRADADDLRAGRHPLLHRRAGPDARHLAGWPSRINVVYAADLIGAALGCLVLIPLLNSSAPRASSSPPTALAATAAVLFAAASRARGRGPSPRPSSSSCHSSDSSPGSATFDVVDTKGHQGDRVLFSKWNSFSRIGVYERAHGDWSLSPTYTGALPETRFMDIDSAASTPILRVAPDLSNAGYLRYELTALAYHLKSGLGPPARDSTWRRPSSRSRGFTALVIGPGGGRDLATALVFGAARVDAVEINPIIANDVMRERVPRLLRRHLRRTRASASSSTTAGASSGARPSGTTSSRRRSSTPGRRRPPARTR